MHFVLLHLFVNGNHLEYWEQNGGTPWFPVIKILGIEMQLLTFALFKKSLFSKTEWEIGESIINGGLIHAKEWSCFIVLWCHASNLTIRASWLFVSISQLKKKKGTGTTVRWCGGYAEEWYCHFTFQE